MGSTTDAAPDNGSSSMFPSPGTRLLSACVAFLGVSILAHCFSRRLASERLTTIRGWRDLTWPRFCILVVMLVSWCFLLSSSIFIFGLGLDQNTSNTSLFHKGSLVCSLAIHFCFIFYGTSKFFIYCFLIEKVYVVWAPTTETKRFHVPIYVVCVITVTSYVVITILMYIGSRHHITINDKCVIGLSKWASIPLLSYDIYVNLLLTGLFLWPLVRTGRISGPIRRIAGRTLIGAIVALTTSTVNILMLTLEGGGELGWICLDSCGADVICNAVALFWVTTRKNGMASGDFGADIPANVTQDVWAVADTQCGTFCGKTTEHEEHVLPIETGLRRSVGSRVSIVTPNFLRIPNSQPRTAPISRTGSMKERSPTESMRVSVLKNPSDEDPVIYPFQTQLPTQLQITEESIEASCSHTMPSSHLEREH